MSAQAIALFLSLTYYGKLESRTYSGEADVDELDEAQAGREFEAVRASKKVAMVLCYVGRGRRKRKQ